MIVLVSISFSTHAWKQLSHYSITGNLNERNHNLIIGSKVTSKYSRMTRVQKHLLENVCEWPAKHENPECFLSREFHLIRY